MAKTTKPASRSNYRIETTVTATNTKTGEVLVTKKVPGKVKAKNHTTQGAKSFVKQIVGVVGKGIDNLVK